MRMHIIGIGTTFMMGLAVLARQSGHEVIGSDSCIDNPTRTKLEEVGVKLIAPFSAENLTYKPDLVVIGNELYPNNPELLEVHRLALPCISGELWLQEYVLHDKWTKNMPPDYHDEKTKQNNGHKSIGKQTPKLPELGAKPKRIVR